MSTRTWCPEPEVRAHDAVRSTANFGFKRGTRIIKLLVVLDSEVRNRGCRNMMRTPESDSRLAEIDPHSCNTGGRLPPPHSASKTRVNALLSGEGWGGGLCTNLVRQPLPPPLAPSPHQRVYARLRRAMGRGTHLSCRNTCA